MTNYNNFEVLRSSLSLCIQKNNRKKKVIRPKRRDACDLMAHLLQTQARAIVQKRPLQRTSISRLQLNRKSSQVSAKSK
ncbi:hypothetical protein FGO68_gene6779 [Halteria grandinella]|uniref:Uncharacterized protein n=1 Tax=Halteria grandinella TaxID=5974 RepID=A0A8J8NWB0_HALGN|nr:hypothetical protein FGO68_gene6779 [Halteria grandinella]